MKRAVNYLNLGVLNQTFIIYEGKEQIDSFKVQTAKMIEELPTKVKELGITQVDFIGPPVYLKGLIKRLAAKSDETIVYNII